MAQIIRHRRGSLEALSSVTSSFQKGELIIVSGSSNITASNGSSILFAANESGSVQAVNRFLIGDNAPNVFPEGTYNGLVKGVPYYASGSSTLYLLGSGGNDVINLEGNIQNFSASVATSLSNLSSSIGSGDIGNAVSLLNSFTQSAGVRLDNLETTSASVNTSVSNLNSFSSSQLTQNSTLATYTGSVETRLVEVGVVSGSLISSASVAKNTNDSQDVSISNINSFTQSFSQSVATDFSASVASVSALSASVASVTGDFSSSVATSFSASNASITALSASVASVTGDFSSSVATSFSASAYNVSASNAVQDIRIDQLASFTGSYATTGSNIFQGNQVITGSIYVTNDLIVYGSSSLFNVTASALDIGQNTIVLNTATPAVRFGGISVADSGSNEGASGSLFWDSLNNHWLYQHPSASGEGYNSAILISGPKNSGSLGDEATLTAGKIMVAVGEDHIGDSIMTQTEGKITLAGGLDVTGEISASTINGIGNVSQFSTSVDSRLDTIESSIGSGGSLGSRVDSLETSSANLNSFTSSQLTQNSDLATYTSSVETRLTEIGVVSGSLISSASAAKTTNDSQDVSITNLNTFSASVNTSVSALNSSSASQQVSLDNLNAKTGSYATTGSNVFIGTQTISGSVNVSGSTNFNGAVAVDDSNVNLTNNSSLNLTNGSSIYVNGNGVISGSIVGIGNVTAFSTSVDIRLSNLQTTSASVNTSITNLNASSASQQASIDALNAYTSSNTSTTALNAFTASANERFTEIGVVSGSLIVSASNAKTTNDSQDVSISNINTFSSSVLTQLTEIGVVSGSLISSASAAKTTNDSQDVSISNINSFTQSFSQSVATEFSASDYRLDVIEASIGSGGSLGSRVDSLETSSANLNTFSASVLTQLTELGVVSGSLIVSASTAKTTNDTQDVSITNLNTFSSSTLTRVSNLETTSASVNTSVANLNTFSSSTNVSLDQLEIASASAKVAISELNNYTSSLKTAFALSGQNVEVLGDFTVRGSTTIIDSTTVQIGDNIIELNGSGVANGGLIVRDATAPSTVSGSLLWDTTNDYWKAGIFGNESKVLVAGGDSVVSGSSQITISNTTGYTTFSSSIATDFSASNASLTALSASVSSVTGEFSSSVATSFSASAATVVELSSSFSTSQNVQNGRLDAIESFTSSIDTTIQTKIDLVGVFSSSIQTDITQTTGFTTYSGSVATEISASNARILVLETTIDGGTY